MLIGDSKTLSKHWQRAFPRAQQNDLHLLQPPSPYQEGENRGVSAPLAHPSNCIRIAEKHFGAVKSWVGLQHRRQCVHHAKSKMAATPASALALPEEASQRCCEADPAALCSPTHATIDHVTSKAHTGNLTFLTLTLHFHHTGSSVVLNPTHRVWHLIPFNHEMLFSCVEQVAALPAARLEIWRSPNTVMTPFKNEFEQDSKRVTTPSQRIWASGEGNTLRILSLIRSLTGMMPGVCWVILFIFFYLLLIWTLCFFFSSSLTSQFIDPAGIPGTDTPPTTARSAPPTRTFSSYGKCAHKFSIMSSTPRFILQKTEVVCFLLTATFPHIPCGIRLLFSHSLKSVESRKNTANLFYSSTSASLCIVYYIATDSKGANIHGCFSCF